MSFSVVPRGTRRRSASCSRVDVMAAPRVSSWVKHTSRGGRSAPWRARSFGSSPYGMSRSFGSRRSGRHHRWETGVFRESELVDLTSLDPTIRLDIRYASTDNFMNAVFYEDSRAFLQRPGAVAVARAHRALAPYGYGLLIHDGYRPWYVTKMFWDATPAHQREFVANPANGSRHNRGAAVDLSLYDLLTGEPVEMPGSYDEFSRRSYADYPGGTTRQRWHRELLRQVMEAEGFTVNSGEWWHFDYRDWSEYGIQNDVFGEIRTPPPA